MSNPITGPAWDNSSEYTSIEDQKFTGDIDSVKKSCGVLGACSNEVAGFVTRLDDLDAGEIDAAVSSCQKGIEEYERAIVLLRNVSTYASCILSVDGSNEEAKETQTQLEGYGAELASALNGINLFLKLCSEEIFQKVLTTDKARSMEFRLRRERELRDHALSLAEEALAIGLGVHGPTAWSTLYSNISGSLSCDVTLEDGTTKTVGLAEAASLQQHKSRDVRESAWRAANKAWESQEEACSSVLNSLSGWRHEIYKKRSHTKPMNFLDPSLHQACIAAETLDAMMGAVEDFKPESQRVLRNMAKVLGLKQLAPWDLGAPVPQIDQNAKSDLTSFDDAVDLIESCFNEVDPAMGEFVRMMVDNKWVEGTVGPKKRPGAYCTGFLKSRTPRVYMTYTGTLREVKTLAHELGHAFHSWVMRDMDLFQSFYPMTLAETASIFAETIVNERLLDKAQNTNDKLGFSWSAAREADGILVNVASRFTFEKAYYEARPNGSWSPRKFKENMSKAWSDWYGDTLSEMDPMFWASKLHFSLSGVSFYNFPYIFGYLFSLGIYARREEMGKDFYPAYVGLLRDTGSMTAEEVARKHLDQDLTKPDFWQASLDIVKKDIDRFESVVESL